VSSPFFLSWRTKARKVKPETLPAHSLAHSPRAQSLSPRRNGMRARNSPAQSSTADGRTNKPSVKSGGKDCTSARRTTRSRSGACLLDLSLPLHRLSLSLSRPIPLSFCHILWLLVCPSGRPGRRARAKVRSCTITTPGMVFLLFQKSLLHAIPALSPDPSASRTRRLLSQRRERERAHYREDLPSLSERGDAKGCRRAGVS
jgi:hypothetical protein